MNSLIPNPIYKYIRFELFKQSVLLVWPFSALLIGIIILLAEISYGELGYRLNLGGMVFPISQNGMAWLNTYFMLVIFLVVLVVPKLFYDLLSSKKIIMVMGKGISRTRFIYSCLMGIILTMFFMALSNLFIVFGIYLNVGNISTSILISILFLPLAISLISILIFLLVELTNSYTGSVFLLLLYLFISSLLSNRAVYLGEYYNNPFVNIPLDIIYYITPRASDLLSMSVNFIKEFEFIKFLLVIFSFLPVSFLSWHSFKKRDL